MRRRLIPLVSGALFIASTIFSIDASYAASYTAPGDTNGYCNQSVTLGTGTAVSDSITGSNCVVKFTGTGSYTWVRPAYISKIRVLVIGGGGGGGGDYGGGGGAGGFIDSTLAISLATQNFSIYVANGGSGNAGNTSSVASTAAGNGETSTAFGFSAIGGGGGGSPDLGSPLYAGRAGGSGGGSGAAGTVSGSNGTSGQGNNGGTSHFDTNYQTVMTGGGGGAGGAGANSGTNGLLAIGGAGGSGSSSDITGIATYYAGGGGGGTHIGSGTCTNGTNTYGSTGGGASGGSGGGGSAGQCLNSGVTSNNGNAGANGTANTGGGGGGGTVSTGRTTAAHGGNGGTGVVIISYAYISSAAPVLTLPNGQSLIYRTLIALTATAPEDGYTTFYFQGKRIPGCIRLAMSASGNNFQAVCNWRPSIHTTANISATITPKDTFASAASGAAVFAPARRTGNR